MLVKSLLTAAAVATVAATLSAPAQAKKLDVDVYLGIEGPRPDYYEPRYPIYDEPAYVRPRPVYYGISCEEGRQQVRDEGFRKVRAIDCGGRRYTYRARQGGNRYIVKVSRRSGEIISVQQTY
jgi:hypothetical protein